MTSLLADLKAATPPEGADEHPWALFKRALPLLVPGAEVSKMSVFNDGRVGVRVRSPLRGIGSFYVVAVMDRVGTGLPDGRREVRLGASNYRDEADAMVYDSPIVGWIEPQPGAMVAWVAGVLLTTRLYDRPVLVKPQEVSVG